MKYLSYRREEFEFDRDIYLTEEKTLNPIGLRITALLQTSSSFSMASRYEHLSKMCVLLKKVNTSHMFKTEASRGVPGMW